MLDFGQLSGWGQLQLGQPTAKSNDYFDSKLSGDTVECMKWFA